MVQGDDGQTEKVGPAHTEGTGLIGDGVVPQTIGHSTEPSKGSITSNGGSPSEWLRIEVNLDALHGSHYSRTWTCCCLLFSRSAIFGQAKIVWPIALYMVGFMRLSLHEFPTHIARIILAFGVVTIGLACFLEGLKVGVMPLGKAVGKTLPSGASCFTVFLATTVLGVLVTYAEPGLGVLQELGSTVDCRAEPYLYSLLNAWSPALVAAVALGVGLASSIGILRLRYGFSLKPLVYGSTFFALLLSVVARTAFDLGGVLGLAWDCGAVTTGPVTVPVVIGLGVGVASTKNAGNPLSGFGVVTLASLFPVITVLLLALIFRGTVEPEDLIHACGTGQNIRSSGIANHKWYSETPYEEILLSTRALVPVTVYLLILLRYVGHGPPVVAVQPAVSNTEMATPGAEMGVRTGVIASWFGFTLVNIGLKYGLTALGQQEGAILPREYTTVNGLGALHGFGVGFAHVLVFAFILGIGATMAEPVVAVLGCEVEQLTSGRFSRNVIRIAIPVGVAIGLCLGIARIVLHADLLVFLVPLYAVALLMTICSPGEFVNIGWDSAGVTTGPVTVPLALCIGSSLGYVHGTQGFGILACSSICPILSVLLCGLPQTLRRRSDLQQGPDTAGADKDEEGTLAL